jgi:hypothetical protein
MENKDNLKMIIKQINTGRNVPALKLVESNPEVAALISKLVKPVNASDFNMNRKNNENNLNQSQLQTISDVTKARSKDNESIVQLFPDIELAIQILVSSVLSPKDMVKTDLIYKTKDTILPSELTLKLNTVVSAHFENYYGIRDELSDILRHTLFDTGSYIKAVIPESIVDEIINGNNQVSTESLTDLYQPRVGTNPLKIKSLGILGNSGKRNSSISSLESFLNKSSAETYEEKIYADNKGTRVALEGLEVSDNYQMLKLPKLIEAGRRDRIHGIVKNRATKGLTPSVESLDKKLSVTEISNVMYKGNSTGAQTFLTIPSVANTKRKSIGRPLVLRLPSESVIPVYIPGDESKHIGCFLLVDQDGNPVSRHTNDTSQQGLNSLMNSQKDSSLSSLLIGKAKANLANNEAVPTLDNITKVYTSIVENDLMERLQNGIYGNGAVVSNNEEIYRIMLSRHLSSKYTRLVYLPAELTTYFAFKYFANGVGKSYLDDIKILTSIRGILLFAKIMAMVKSAISITHVGVTLDPMDPDPDKTIELARHEVTKMRQNYFPLGINSSPDLVDWIQRAGIEMSFEGHPGIPSTKFDFESKNLQHQIPDSDLDEQLRKQTYMSFGISPETIDAGLANPEFATTVISNNILLSKRIIQLQIPFTAQLTDHCVKLMRNDEVAKEEMRAIIIENIGSVENIMTDEEKTYYAQDSAKFVEDLIDRYLENLKLELPRPDITTIQTQSAAFNDYEEALDKVMDSWISSDFLTSELAGQISGNVDSVKAVVKSYFIRRWMSDNGYMPELNDIVTSDEEGKPTLDIYNVNQAHIEGLVRSLTKFMVKMKPIANASDKDLENNNVVEGDGSSSESSDSGDTGGGDGGFGDDGFGDMGDLGGDATQDTPPDDTETKPEEPAEGSDTTT